MLAALVRQVRRLSADYDLAERHTLCARLLRMALGERHAPVVDVGGRAGLLAAYTPYPVVALNPDGTGNVVADGPVLPLASGSAAQFVNIDTLEHLPAARRTPFIQECLRVAQRAVIIAAPLGTPEHLQRERELDAFHRAQLGRAHPYLAEHVRYGLPTLAEIAAWRALPGVAVSFLFFAVDYRWQGRVFARGVIAARQPRLIAALLRAANQVQAMRLWHPLRLEVTPRPTANRFYLLLETAA